MSRFKPIGDWVPYPWPPIGHEMAIPINDGSCIVAKVVAIFKEDKKILVEIGPKQWYGYPKMVRDTKENSIVKVWLFEDAANAAL